MIWSCVIPFKENYRKIPFLISGKVKNKLFTFFSKLKNMNVKLHLVLYMTTYLANLIILMNVENMFMIIQYFNNLNSNFPVISLQNGMTRVFLLKKCPV